MIFEELIVIKLNKTSIASLLAIALAIVLANTAMLDQAKTKEVASSLKVTKSKANKAKEIKINWQKPSENKPYPKVADYPKMWVKVSKAKQRTYLMNGSKILYTMYCSTGSGGDRATPEGTFHIQAERGDFFYNQESGEGAKYWVSWKDHGVYLFHTVPTDSQGHFVESEAEKLGKNANSHGCIRLSVPDAKWFYENIKEGTKVVITNS
ncbi:L,D-transpeptidase [Lactobacillus jensenii]|uniref:L,D-transpeptidase n=1 Tax=Lactobacillus jensenii TaxID=109790 RepID=UPI0013CF70E6|nr:L,D-transpeptidase [Lactobacillus jensenii]NGG31982.1 L,D-transpeptidase [Lactobacillus jensenii]